MSPEPWTDVATVLYLKVGASALLEPSRPHAAPAGKEVWVGSPPAVQTVKSVAQSIITLLIAALDNEALFQCESI